MRRSIFEFPHPSLKKRPYRYPKWELNENNKLGSGEYKISALDFNISLDDSIRAKNFREYDETIHYHVIQNDGEKQSLIWLTDAKNIFNAELTQMPEYYITRLVFNENHKTVIILRNGRVYGGISFRPFKDRDFAEIAFCAVSTKQQIRGYGAHIMAHVKTYLQAIGIYNILTYADNTAVGYFKRQGFTLEMKLDTNKWVHYIKDYQGATLIHCQIRPDIDYLRIGDVVSQQKKLVSSLLPKTDITRVTHWPVKSIKGITIDKEPKVDVINQMHLIVSSIKLNSRSWPFLNPVSLKDAPNYLEIVQKPMDLSTIEKNIEENKYQTLDQFVDDMKLIFTNCYAYNAVDSVYHRSAKELEKYFEKLLMKTKEGRRR